MNTTEIETQFAKWRAQSGWSLREVSGISGLSAGFLSRIERGLQEPSPAVKVTLSRTLHVPVADLFEPEGSRDDEVDA